MEKWEAILVILICIMGTSWAGRRRKRDQKGPWFLVALMFALTGVLAAVFLLLLLLGGTIE